MKQNLITVLAMIACSLFCGADWLQFRGPNGASFAEGETLPATWIDNDPIAWKAELPGRGPSGPIVVRDRVFVTCSGGADQDHLYVASFDAETGKRLWIREFWATGRTLCHPFSAVAAPTPASDGKRIFAFYSSNDLVCLDLDGNLLWYRGLAYDYPKARNDAGMGSSPVVVADTVVVQIENQGDSFAAGINAITGETRWRIAREPVAGWSSPVAMPDAKGGRHAVLLQSHSGLTAHDALTGKELWRFDEICGAYPSPAVRGRRIYIPAEGLHAFEWQPGQSQPSLIWKSSRLKPFPSSPIITDRYVYALNSSGSVTCADPDTGEKVWQIRVLRPGKHWATPVVAGDRMVCINQEGQVFVVQLGSQGESSGPYDLGETILGSPAVSNGAMYVRSDRHLWKFSNR
ncbi:MAG: PQQ-binding-like beta-propeller repeat protein [Pirellulaceae bacterium]